MAVSANNVDVDTAVLQGLVLQRDRELLGMWREDGDAAKLCDKAEANDEHVHYHDCSDSVVTFGLHKGKTFGVVFKEYPAYARWANRQQTSKPPLLHFAKYVRDIITTLPYAPQPFAREYPATVVQGPGITGWPLPLPFASRLPPAKESPVAFALVTANCSVMNLAPAVVDSATQPIAYDDLRSVGWYSKRATNARPLTFVAFADLYPIQTLHFYYSALEILDIIMGQQRDFMDFFG